MAIEKAATIAAVASGTAGVQGVAATSGLRFAGFSAKEDTGTAAATFVIRHGTSNTGTPIAFVSLAAGAVVTQFFGETGLYAPNGIFIDRLTGTTELSLWTRTGE